MTHAEHSVRADELFLLAVQVRRKALLFAPAKAARYLEKAAEISAKASRHAAKAAEMEVA